MRAALFDLDDTLFPQSQWLSRVWDVVADEAERVGVDAAELRTTLSLVAAEGSDKGRIINRSLERLGVDIPVEPLVEAFRSYRSRHLEPYRGVRRALASLARDMPIGLVTDGDPQIQRSKLRALALDSKFDAIVYSDELGREFRKPKPEPFLRAAMQLGVEAEDCFYVGDRPEKDTAGALAAGMRPVRVRCGEYAHLPDEPEPWFSVPDVLAAIECIKWECGLER